jgi:hypothetical protein
VRAARQSVVADGPLRGPPLNRSVRHTNVSFQIIKFMYVRFVTTKQHPDTGVQMGIFQTRRLMPPASEVAAYASNPMPEPISIEGPVELIDGKLTLRIPLEAGGDQLAPLARGIGEIDGEFLDVVIQPWLAEKLRIEAGSLVFVDNKNGKFTITRSAANDETR